MELIKEKETTKKRSEKIQIIFLILLVVAIVSMISAIIVVVKNAQMFRENPIALGINQYGFDKCSCSIGNEFVEINKEGFIIQNPTLEFKLGE